MYCIILFFLLFLCRLNINNFKNLLNYEESEEIFRNFLKKGKYRITPERFIVLKYALGCKSHFSADELFLRMRSRVSRATVYNTLDKLVECNLLTMRNFGDKLKRYEATAAKESHDHLICQDCGRIIEFNSKTISEIQKTICEENDFEPSNYSFNIYARCRHKETCPYFSSRDKSR